MPPTDQPTTFLTDLFALADTTRVLESTGLEQARQTGLQVFLHTIFVD